MRRYISLVWNPCDQTQGHFASRLKTRIVERFATWCCPLDKPGVCAFISPADSGLDEVYRLHNGQGVVIGKLFERRYVDSDEHLDHAPSRVIFDEASSARLLSSRGLALKDKLWGTYVAFLSDTENRRLFVLRDPLGLYPCQSLKIGEVYVYFASLDDVARVESLRLQISEGFLVASLLTGNQHSGKTAYEEIATVLPGQRIEHQAGEMRCEFYWDPLSLSLSEQDLQPRAAVEATGRLVRSCIHAWASCFERIFLQLSGGLDSSIVAACLASAPNHPAVTCANFYSRIDTADERQFAREVAERCHFELMEVSSDAPVGFNLETTESSVIPIDMTTRDAIWSGLRGRLLKSGLAVHLRGDGGDELFHRGNGAIPDSIDNAYRCGISTSLWSVAMNDGLIAETSVWENVGIAVRYGLQKRRFPWRERFTRLRTPGIMADDVATEIIGDDANWHPLYGADLRCSPGKILQYLAILGYTNSFWRPASGSFLQILSPLLSQPFLEFSLAAPFTALRFGGRDRAAARAAFKSDLPPKIINRKYKGLANGAMDDWVGKNLSKVRELIFDGYLLKTKFINRRALETLFAEIPTPGLSAHRDLQRLLSIEVWIRNATRFSTAA